MSDKKITVKAKNVFKITKIPYYRSTGTILDNPPMFPDSEFVTYIGKKDKVNILLRSGQGSVEQNPIFFSDSEKEFYDLFREAKKLNDLESILFKSDEFENIPVRFEIRRLVEAPKSYQDFADAKVSIAQTPYGESSLASSSSLMDSIEPNKKYYYMFRSIDRRGIFSNPTPIFQIEIVENSGAVYPLIKVYEFEKKEKKPTKTLKRLFNIVPRLKQVMPDSTDPLTMGSENLSVFGKTFKLRMTSKKTGKVIDFNVEFEKQQVTK